MSFDSGNIKEIAIDDLTNAEYKVSLETMEEISINKKCVIITPDKCVNYHILLLDEFIKSNLHGKFKNPYNRNIVEFSDENLEILENLRKNFIKSLKNIPHEIFIHFLKILEKINDNNVQIFYFPDVTKIFSILLGVLPIFENLDEALGYYNDDINKIINQTQKNLESVLNTFELELSNCETINKFKHQIEFYTIPEYIKEFINNLFLELLIILNKFADTNNEFIVKDNILDIFYLLDDIHYFFTNIGDKIINNELLEEKMMLMLCKADEKVSELKNIEL